MSYIYPSENFPFLRSIQDAWEDILGEYTTHINQPPRSGLMDLPGLIWPWPEKELYDKGWKAVGLIYKGRDDFRYTQEVKKQFPITNSLVTKIPGVYMAGFSILEPKTRIYPHKGYTHDVFRSHLGLITPKGAWLEVDGERVEWQQGKMFVFDDMVTHSAYNGSDEERVILLLDFYKK